jgi:ParB-like chromosome segregation protein Spo0J
MSKTSNVNLNHISPALRSLAEPIEGLTLDPSNVRLHPVRNLEAIKGSLRRFGQQRPILADANGVIIAGNGTLAAARELGWTHIAVSRSDLVGAEATAYAIADNRAAELAEWDREALARQLESLQVENAEAAFATGWTPDEIAALISEARGRPSLPDDAAGKEIDESCADDVETVTCPHCGGVVPL